MADHVCMWAPRKRGAFGEACQTCGDVFPCQYECAHADCIETRGKNPKCCECSEPVKPEELFRKGAKTRVFAAHKNCAKKMLASKPEAGIVDP